MRVSAEAGRWRKCAAEIRRQPLRFKGAERQETEAMKMKDDPEYLELWLQYRNSYSKRPTNGKLPGCHANPSTPLALMSEPSTPRSSATSGRKRKRDDFEEEDAAECDDPRAGLEDRADRQLQRKLFFTNTNGYHWPGWYFAELFKEWEEKPKMKRRLTVAGEAGGRLG